MPAFSVSRPWSKADTFDTGDPSTSDDAKRLLQQVEDRLKGQSLVPQPNSSMNAQSIKGGYSLVTAKRRVGQGIFRVRVADAYHMRCAITGERTFPVLQAATLHTGNPWLAAIWCRGLTTRVWS